MMVAQNFPKWWFLLIQKSWNEQVLSIMYFTINNNKVCNDWLNTLKIILKKLSEKILRPIKLLTIWIKKLCFHRATCEVNQMTVLNDFELTFINPLWCFLQICSCIFKYRIHKRHHFPWIIEPLQKFMAVFKEVCALIGWNNKIIINMALNNDYLIYLSNSSRSSFILRKRGQNLWYSAFQI